MKTKLIIFDFDGTLANTTGAILWTYRNTISQSGIESRSDEQCRATIGLPLKEGFRQLYPDFTDAELDNCVNTYRDIFYKHQQQLIPELYPGVKATLDHLANLGIRMAVASSRNYDSLVDFCGKNGILPHFDLIIGADDVKHAKPDPEPVLLILNRLAHDSSSTVVVGDMPVDIVMGRGAGCDTIGVTYGNSSRNDLIKAGAHHIIDSFPMLIDCIS